MSGEAQGYEYRACVADETRHGVFEEESEPFTDEQAARDEMARMLTVDYAEPPYDVGWVERRLAPTPWERLP